MDWVSHRKSSRNLKGSIGRKKNYGLLITDPVSRLPPPLSGLSNLCSEKIRKTEMMKMPAKKIKINKQGGKFPFLYIVLISVFVISITIFGISRIKKTITFRDTNAHRKPTLGELLDGIMRMDENGKLAISPEQARKILPHLITIQGNLDNREMLEKLTGKASQKIEQSLDSKQMDYITSNFEPVPPDFIRLYLKEVITFLKERAI